MKYVESQEQSIALFRLVIAEMNQHDAPFNPLTFAVCYEHLAGINPRLSHAFEEAKRVTPRLSAEAMLALHRDHVADADATTAETARGDLQRLMEGVAQSAVETGTHAREYGSRLAGLSEALAGEAPGAHSAVLAPRLTAVADGTAQMQQVVATLERTMSEGAQEIERLRHALERARIESVTDALSRLRNRKGFDEALAQTLQTRPAAGLAHCLLVFDIDHFKRVNDTHGHPVGDTVIETVGQILGRVAGGAGVLAARIGGEEFAVILPASTSAAALQLAEAVRTLVRSMKIRKRGSHEVIATVTISAGVAAWVPGDDARSLLASADAALYRAKEAGRDRVVVA